MGVDFDKVVDCYCGVVSVCGEVRLVEREARNREGERGLGVERGWNLNREMDVGCGIILNGLRMKETLV